MFKKFILVGLLALSFPSFSADQSGKITGYIPYGVNGKDMLIFQLQGNVTGGCNTTGRFAIDSTTVQFKNTVAAVMAAYHSQSNVTVRYTGESCSAWGNAWDIITICVGNLPC